ncbi:S1C family serine protease [Micromonosporaceae bacterium Da 78-11]
MTATYDPFTPAGTPEQRGSVGRRRAEDRWAEDRWAEDRRQWSAPVPVPAQPVAPTRWIEDPRWIGETAHGDRRGSRAAYPAPTGGYPITPPAAPAYAGPSVDPGPAVAPDRRPRRAKPVILGLVLVLLLVAAWQAYRIEGMHHGNADLAAALTAEKGRTDRLEKQLAGVFDPEAVSSRVLPSVFRVRAGDFTGTAFSVGDKAADGQANLMTNYHVVAAVWSAGGRKVSLERGATRIDATIVKVNKGKDLALLRAGQTIEGLATAGGQVKPGQQVVVVGAPLGLDDTVTTGVISAYRPEDPDGPTIQFDAPINPGNSGGPVVNASQQVVGLATAKAKDAEGIGLAIPIKTACDTFAVC